MSSQLFYSLSCYLTQILLENFDAAFHFCSWWQAQRDVLSLVAYEACNIVFQLLKISHHTCISDLQEESPGNLIILKYGISIHPAWVVMMTTTLHTDKDF